MIYVLAWILSTINHTAREKREGLANGFPFVLKSWTQCVEIEICIETIKLSVFSHIMA